MTRFVLATANPDKADEIHGIMLDPATGFVGELVPRPADVPDVDETGMTLEENARLKARALAAATGLPALADDTGLEVDALGGEPGVYSARYSGPGATYTSNCAKLLSALVAAGAVTAADRTARFATVAFCAWPDGREVWARGEVDGVITDEPRGTNGFGYDPVFAPSEGDGRTFAEMSPTDKRALSHRGRAFCALAALLAQNSGDPRQET